MEVAPRCGLSGRGTGPRGQVADTGETLQPGSPDQGLRVGI